MSTSLVLRVCRPDFTSRDGFTWPAEIGAEVSAPDWEKTAECGNGLHGWLYGQGDHSCVSHWQEADAKWLVLEVPSAEIIKLDGKCKFPRAVVRFIGGMSDAADFIIANEPNAAKKPVIGAKVNAGDHETAVVAGLGTATTGDYGTATAGKSGTATAGHQGEIRIRWWDAEASRNRTAIAYVGEDGIKPNTKYRLNDQHQFEEA